MVEAYHTTRAATTEESTDTELSYSERIKSSPEFQLFKTDFENDVELFRENMNLVIQKNTSLDVNTLLKNTMAIVANHSGSISILDMLQNMREYDDSTYTHSLNVALICNILAGWLKLSDEEIELATACGLFHDVFPQTAVSSLKDCGIQVLLQDSLFSPAFPR